MEQRGTESDLRKWQDRESLRHIISQWNANRLDLFSLSEPNEDFEFHGVMRFYFQDAGQKIATKCIRVSSTASTQAVIETLIEKFRPDMKMLHMAEYALYEIHPNGEERCLGADEKPLLVQLNWHKDDREGRFLLRRADEKSTLPATQPPEESSFRRKLSKREKRNMKKENKLRKLKSGSGAVTGSEDRDDPSQQSANKGSVAEKLYTELPETSFTRSISNPEAVMRRRRQQKLERKLQLFRSKDGGPDTGGTLKIYGESLCKDVPYKTLLLSVRETAAYVVREMLDKYALNKEDPANYCLVQVTGGGAGSETTPTEYILEDDECPLSILMHHPPSQGPVMFHVRRRPADQQARRRKKKLSGSSAGGGNSASSSTIGRSGHHPGAPGEHGVDDDRSMLPFLLELNPDGSEVRQSGVGSVRRHFLPPTVTEVGSDRPSGSHPGQPGSPSGPSIQLFGPGIQPRHCVVAHTEGIVTLTPCSPQAETYVNGQRIYETTLLQHGSVIRFGRAYQFRFIDPNHEFRSHSHGTNQQPVNYERFQNRTNQPVGTDPILPAVLELPEEVEDAFLHALIPNLDTRQVAFRLAPTYALYLMARYRASTHFRPELNPMERAQRLTLTLSRVGAMMQAVVQERYADPPSLAFWMANASELLHFLKSDRHICAFSLDGQDLLAEAVQSAFRNASVCLTGELLQSLPPMLQEREEPPDDEAATAQVLAVLSSTMGLLRRCRVNAALTIQLFSQLFHALNAAIFNRLVGVESPRLPAYQSAPGAINYCSRQWGIRLSKRLRRLEAWAERQGLELAADCHLARVMQAAHLLQAPKSTPEQLADVASSCFKLNSLQLQALLERYRSAPDEPQLPGQLIAAIVRVAEATADELQLADGRPLRLDEDSQLAVPFLLPDDGYSCDVMRGIPTGLVDVIGPLQQAGLCRLTPQPTSSGLWTIYMGENALPPRAPSAAAGDSQQPPPPQQQQQPPAQQQQQQPQQQPEVQVLQLRKSSDSMGLSIVAARGTGQQQLGIYIKSVVKGGSADVDGRLQAGDQLLSVDGYSLVGITQDRAAEILMRTGTTVRLEVAKQAAMYHGLATLLSQPSPTSTVSRSTLNLTSKQAERSSRPPIPQQQPQQPPFQERLVDWDRPPTSVGASNRSNSNSSPSLADPVPGGPTGPTGPRNMTLRTANSKSVPALHEPNGAEAIQEYPPQQHPPQAANYRGMMANQRTLSAQHLPPGQIQQPRYPVGPPGQPVGPNSPTRTQGPQYFASSPPPPHQNHQMPMQQHHQQLQQQQQPNLRSRSVQNLSEAQQQQQQQQQAANNRNSLRARHPSNQISEDERQYQNIQLYQQQQQQAMQQQQQQSQAQQLYPKYTQQPQQQPYNPQMQQQHQQQFNQQQQQRGLLSPVNRPSHLRNASVIGQSSESPPPPPPPPTSTHPLLNQAANQQGGNNPWDREEKEREIQRRQEAARMWMESQISDLEALGPHGRTAKQEEQLRAMKLEMEFRKRAQEAARDEEDEEGDEEEDGGLTSTSMDRRGMLRLVQEDLERARQWRMEKQASVTSTSHPQQFHHAQTPQYQIQNQQAPINQQMVNGTSTNNNNTSAVPDQERLRKIETFQRKQRELEATQAAEERILREAQRRKEEESAQRWSRPPGPPAGSAPSQRLDTLVGNSQMFQAAVPVVSQSEVPSRETKRVSFFQDKPVAHTYDDNANQEKGPMTPVREDPDAFIQEAENMLADHSTPSGGVVKGDHQLLLTGVSTPGVIGAQEVYRDPRVRRLAEQQQQKAQLKAPGPEKLSFQEKMRMFALESGEPQTPKDKSKVSKAQREIELKPSPLTK